MNKYRFLQSFELFLFFIRNNQGSDKHTIHAVKSIAKSLDDSFLCSDFDELQLLDFKQNSYQNEDLFVDFSSLEFHYINFQVLTRKEAVIIHTCVEGWLRKFDLDINRTLLFRLLNLGTDFINILEHYFSVDTVHLSINGNEIFQLVPDFESKDGLEGKWVDSNKPNEIDIEKQFIFPGLSAAVKVLYIEDLKIFLLLPKEQTQEFRKNGEKSPCYWEYLEVGDRIEIGGVFSIDFYSLKNRYLHHKWGKKLWIEIRNLAFTYPNGKGIKEFSMDFESGWLVGLLGKEGCGKSTLLEILAGLLKYSRGEIGINGYKLSENLYQLKNIIGYVSDQDLLYNELTVYENLYLTAKLYLGKKTDEEIIAKVSKLLKDLDLDYLKRIVVGSISDKNLQPGQRRMLNIALELIRDPHILIVDNSIAPISTSESSKIIEVLTNYSYQGKIVITSITQTNSSSFLNFDRIFVLDDGGFPVYFGKSIDCAQYFKNIFSFHPKIEKILDADDILQIINQRIINKTQLTNERYKSPLVLYRHFVEHQQPTHPILKKRRSLPENILHTPTLDRQYAIFSLRNIKTNLAQTRGLIYTVLVSPLLALIVSAFLHESPFVEYSFNSNQHIPQFYFISIILAILMGLIQSSNEIFREQSIYKKQEYLNLSRFSYVNSKITLLFFICLIQSFLFVGISVFILEIKNSILVFGAVFFSSQAFGVLLGLIFSASQRSLENIYTRSIPLVIILQLLFGGGFIDLSSYTYKSTNYTPFFADLMVSRWAYECVMVDQYVNNPFMQHFYEPYKNQSQSDFYASELLPILQTNIASIYTLPLSEKQELEKILLVASNYLKKIPAHFDAFPYENIDMLNEEAFNTKIQIDLLDYLEYLKIYFYKSYENAIQVENDLVNSLNDSLGSIYLEALYSKYMNEAVAEKVTRGYVENPIKYLNNMPIQNNNNIYQSPVSLWGKTTIFLPQKQFVEQTVGTVEFNLSIIWLFNLLIYIILVSNLLVKVAGRSTLRE